jgi:hypothetical protein
MLLLGFSLRLEVILIYGRYVRLLRLLFLVIER